MTEITKTTNPETNWQVQADANSAAASDAVYRPLSLLALAGFVVSALCAGAVLLGGIEVFAVNYPRQLILLTVGAILGGAFVSFARKKRSASEMARSAGVALAGLVALVGMGGLVAFSGTTPWLLPIAYWFILAVAVGLCWLALTRIAAAEGTLGGASLALGLGLSLFFGLNYAAYLASTSFAVKTQARECSDEFLEALIKGDLEQAYLRSLTPRNRPNNPSDLRKAIEETNIPIGPSGGAYSSFLNKPIIHLFQIAGPETKYELVSVVSEFIRGGYQVNNIYKITSPVGSFDCVIATFGQEEDASKRGGDASSSGRGPAVRRQWHVEVGKCGIEKQIAPTDEGKILMGGMSSAREMGRAWTTQMNNRRLGEAYLLTLDLPIRQKQAAGMLLRESALLGLTGLGLPGGVKATAASTKDLEDGFKAYEVGKPLVDFSDLYPRDGEQRQRIVNEVLPFFAGKAKEGWRIDLPPVELPVCRRVGDTIVMAHPITITYTEEKNSRSIEGVLEVVGPWSKEPQNPEKFRVKAVRFFRVQNFLAARGAS